MDQLKTAIREKGIAVEELCQYSYDTNRNQTDIKNTKTGEDQTYVYDAENRLSQVSMTKDGKTAVIQQNIYNGEGQRIQKVDGDETTNYYYQNGVVAYTTDANGEQNSQNLIGTDGNVLATERFQQNATQYYLYNKDIQESTSSLVKELRKVTMMILIMTTVIMILLTMTLLTILIRSEEHTSELQSRVDISYAVFCLKKIFF